MEKDKVGARLSTKTFWLLAAVVAVILVIGSTRDITRPFQGLHAWGRADGARFARAHVVYGLGYTKGIMTEAAGYPPPAEPRRYVNHPQLSSLLIAAPMYVFGPHEWVARAYWALMSLLTVLVYMKILRDVWCGAGALLAGLLWSIFPLTAFFGTGGHSFLMALLAMMFYLRLIGEIGEAEGPRGDGILAATLEHILFRKLSRIIKVLGGPEGRRAGLWVGLIATNFLCVQLNWSGAFYSLALAIHYAGRCVLRRQWPGWLMTVVLIATPILSASVTFGIMLANFNWDFQRIWDLYAWRSGAAEMTGQMDTLTWAFWFEVFWKHAMTNFGLAVMILALVGLGAHVGRRIAAWQATRDTDSPTPLFKGSPQLLLFLIPAVLQLMLLRGTLIKHQYWELPLSPFIALCGALCLVALWDALKGMGRSFAALTVGIVLAFVGYTCVQGANYYYDIRWQHDDRIALWKELNRLVPPDKKLLVFDPVMDGLLVTQSEAKGEVIRAEPGWYIDRPIERAPTPEQTDATYSALGALSSRLMRQLAALKRDYDQGVLPGNVAMARQQQAIGMLQAGVLEQVRKDMPGLLDTLRRKRAEAPILLLQGQGGGARIHPAAMQIYLDALREQLGRHFEMVYEAPAREGKLTRKQDFTEKLLSTHTVAETEADMRGGVEFYQAGMRPYYVFDLTKSPGSPFAETQP